MLVIIDGAGPLDVIPPQVNKRKMSTTVGPIFIVAVSQSVGLHYSFLNSTYDFGIPHFLIVPITMHYNDNNIFKFYLAGNVQFTWL